MAIAQDLAPFFSIAKVGIELYAEAGPDAFAAVHDLGFSVFADLKLHDIPNTVNRTARVLGRMGVEFLNFHAAGGVEMMKAGIEGLHEGATAANAEVPIALGVTVLTSNPDVSAFPERLQAAAGVAHPAVRPGWRGVFGVRNRISAIGWIANNGSWSKAGGQ